MRDGRRGWATQEQRGIGGGVVDAPDTAGRREQREWRGQGEAFLCVVAVPEGDVRCFVGLPGPMAMLTVDFWAMVGLSPRSLSCRNAGLGRELGLQLAMGAVRSTSPGLARPTATALRRKRNVFPPPPLNIHLGRWMARRCANQGRLDG